MDLDYFFVGNDLVDLLLPENQAKVQNKRWLDKIFVPSEQHIIAQAAHANTMAWLLWSCKESAYKVAIKQGMLPNYRPLDFVVMPNNNLLSPTIRAMVQTPVGVFYTQSAQNTHYVYSVAAAKLFDWSKAFIYLHKFDTLVDCLTAQQWQRPLLQASEQHFNFAPHTLSIQKQLHNVPILCQNSNVLQGFDVSLSHDGVWAAVLIVGGKGKMW